MRGFAEWPCIVTGMVGNLFEIKFFGDQTTHKTTINSFLDFAGAIEIVKSNLHRLKSSLYKKAVREAEIALGIPHELSILNN